MCGITGLFSLTNKNPNRAWLENATQKLQFRGPDNQAVYTDENIGLGHARLSIIDTSSTITPASRRSRSGTSTILGY